MGVGHNDVRVRDGKNSLSAGLIQETGINSTLALIQITSDIEFPSTLSPGCRDLLMMILDKDPLNRLGILDILEHPYIKNSLSGSCRANQFMRSGR